MSDLTQQFKTFASEAGADLVGIASMDRFADWSAETSPASIFPDAKAVITVARRITRGSLRGSEEGTNFNTYSSFGYHWLDTEFVALTVFECVEFLEDRRWEAAPLFPFPPENFAHVAVACGLGEIGINGDLLTPQFGPRQRLQLILTDAPLNPDPIFEGAICSQCMACADSCPLGAISADEFDELTIAGKTMRVARIDYEKCRVCQNGACPNRYHASGKPDRLGAVCNRTCVDALEAQGAVSNIFANRFRNRPPWGIDRTGELVEIPVKPMAGQAGEEGQ